MISKQNKSDKFCEIFWCSFTAAYEYTIYKYSLIKHPRIPDYKTLAGKNPSRELAATEDVSKLLSVSVCPNLQCFVLIFP